MITTALENGRYGGFYTNIKEVPINRNIEGEPYNFNLYIGIWNGTEWVEGATEQEITAYNEAKKVEYNERLQEYVIQLRERSLISTLAKKEKRTGYLKEQDEIYKKKYEAAKNFLENLIDPIAPFQTWHDAIERERVKLNEENGTNISKNAYFQQIRTQGDTRNQRFDMFQSAIEELRITVDTVIDKAQFIRANNMFSLIDEVLNKENITQGTINQIRNRINNINTNNKSSK